MGLTDIDHKGSDSKAPKFKIVLQDRQANNQFLRNLVKGLDGFSHIWVVSYLHLNDNGNGSDLHRANLKIGEHNEGDEQGYYFNCSKTGLVRPPGRSVKVGVLATRAPHRPCGPLGLSLVRLDKVEYIASKESGSNLGISESVILHVSGPTGTTSSIDLIDGTPILDVKPYIPGYDTVEESESVVRVPEWLKTQKFSETDSDSTTSNSSESISLSPVKMRDGQVGRI